MGHIQRRLGRLTQARQHYQICLTLQPECVENHLRLVHLLKAQADLDHAWQLLQQTLAQFPQHPLVLETALDLALARTDYATARALRQNAAGLKLSAHGMLRCGYVDLQAGLYCQALAIFEEIVQTQPEHWPAWNALGEAALAVFEWEKAFNAFQRAFFLRRGPAWNHMENPGVVAAETPPEQISRFKLEHDREQLLYLAQGQKLPEAAQALLPLYGELLQSPGDPITLSTPQRSRLQSVWNAPIYLQHRDWQGPCLNPEQDYAQLQTAFLQAHPPLIYWDHFLTPAALQALWEFCLESTFWRDYYPQDGYLGAFLDDGFISPLLLQLVDELRTALPVLFQDLPLRYMWAFKYSPTSPGIRLHADQSCLNLNFWLTPDAANRDPGGGGLLVYDRPAPPHWRVRDYNSRQNQGLIEHFLKGSQVHCIPHRQNRAVLFDPRLFHRTDPLSFAPGYENHRINVTMLFGEELSPRSWA